MPHAKGVLVESAGPSNIFTDDCDLADGDLREIGHLGSLGATSPHGNGCKESSQSDRSFTTRSRSSPRRSPAVTLLARKHKLIAVGVSENRPRSPHLLLRLLGQRDALSLERIRSSEHVLAPECHGLKATDAVFVPWGREQSQPSLGAWDHQFDPTLTAFAEKLVGRDLESQLL